jgi:hypothetical protein
MPSDCAASRSIAAFGLPIVNQPQRWQALQQAARQWRSFAHDAQHVERAQPLHQRVFVDQVIVEY